MFKKITTDCEIHWDDFNVYALNLSTMVFENSSGFGAEENIIIKIDNDDDKEIAQDCTESQIQGLRENGFTLVYTFYTFDHYLVGYAYTNKN